MAEAWLSALQLLLCLILILPTALGFRLPLGIFTQQADERQAPSEHHASLRQLTGKIGKAARRTATATVLQQGPAPIPSLANTSLSVFQKRFGTLLANATAREDLYAQLDIMLDAQQLQGGESLAADELKNEHAQAVLKAVVQLDSVSKAKGWPACEDVIPLMQPLLDLTQQLGPQLCYPATRRAVLGSILRARLRTQVPWTAACEAVVAQIAARLYNAHRTGAAAKGATEFLHVSKSGGTSMCTVAAANGCSITSTSLYRNCMIKPFDDGPRWVSAAVHNRSRPYEYKHFFLRHGELRLPQNDTCGHRASIMAKKRWMFYSNEYTLHDDGRGPRGAHTCPQLFNVVLLREPVARLKSHIKWIIQIYRSQIDDCRLYLEGKDAAYWRAFAPAVIDNYFVRSLLGEQAYNYPVGSLNQQHLQLARLVLLQYDVIMVLEAPDTNSLHFKYGLGWGLNLKHVYSRNNSRASRIIEQRAKELLPKDSDVLVAANDIDVELYQYGVLLQQLDGFMYDIAEAAGMRPHSDFHLYHGPRIHTGHRGVITNKGTENATQTQKRRFRGNGTCGYLQQDELLSHAGLMPNTEHTRWGRAGGAKGGGGSDDDDEGLGDEPEEQPVIDGSRVRST